MLLVPVRTYFVPRLPFTDEELAILDGPTASPFVRVAVLEMVSMLTFIPSSYRPWSPSVVSMVHDVGQDAAVPDVGCLMYAQAELTNH